MTPALHLQQFGRALRGRLVHAQRARKLRRRGEAVRFWGYNDAGRAMYRWERRPVVIDYVAFSNERRREMIQAFAIPPELLEPGRL